MFLFYACGVVGIRAQSPGEIERQRARLDSSEREERRDALQRLGNLKRPDASEAAATLLNDKEPIVRAMAVGAIASLPSNRIVALLIPLLKDRNEFVRRETAYALGRAMNKAATTALIEAMARDKEAGVRAAAAVASGEIKDEAATSALITALDNRIRAPGIINRVLFRKKEENDFVRRSAARSLGLIKSRAAVPALIAVLGNEKAGDDVRREAARSLGLIGDPAAIAPLQAVLQARDPYLSRLAYEILQSLSATKS